MEKPRLRFWQIWNMSFGFFGIQFGWGLQMANMSAIYEYLGADPDQIPVLWLAAPLTGLIVQPIVGYLSDRTWGVLGRRRPYFLIGALLSSTALVFMPNSSTLWIAAGLLWILDASVNISMEPFRAFVADLLPNQQLTLGFAMQSFLIGAGAVIASALPWILINLFGVEAGASAASAIPASVRLAFYIGAVVFLSAVVWTISSTREYPPEDLDAFRKMKTEKSGIGAAANEIISSIFTMPPTMRRLALVQFFTWLALFIMWIYFSPAVAHHTFGAKDTTDALYAQGVAWGGVCFSVYNGIAVPAALLLPFLAGAVGRKMTHTICLLCGGIGLIAVWGFSANQYLLLVSMVCIGIAWSSILAMPYAILAPSLPQEKTGFYMGVFNFFIVLPQIAAALGGGLVMKYLLSNNRLAAVVIGGCSMVLAAILMQWVEDKEDSTPQTEQS